MANTPGGILRTVGLWTMILAAAGSAGIDFIKKNKVWGWFKVIVALVVVLFELYNYIVKKKTISTEQKDFILRDALFGVLSLALFGIALAGLIVHLAVW